jgi:hypothetical protein
MSLIDQFPPLDPAPRERQHRRHNGHRYFSGRAMAPLAAMAILRTPNMVGYYLTVVRAPIVALREGGSLPDKTYQLGRYPYQRNMPPTPLR